MHRCPQCNRFRGMVLEDPKDVQVTLDIAGGGSIEVRCWLILNCDTCGARMKDSECDWSFDAPPALTEHLAKTAGHNLSVKLVVKTPVDEFIPPKTGSGRDVSNRDAIHWYGFEALARIECNCIIEISIDHKIRCVERGKHFAEVFPI